MRQVREETGERHGAVQRVARQLGYGVETVRKWVKQADVDASIRVLYHEDFVVATPIAEGLFTWPADEPQLIGSRCRTCGVVTFPKQDACPNCTGTNVDEHLLARRGTLWTWTVQGFRPKSPPYEGPADFEPYPVGYVDLPGEVKVETLLVDVDSDELRIGAEMELAIVPFRSSVDDRDLVTFAFRPVGTGG